MRTICTVHSELNEEDVIAEALRLLDPKTGRAQMWRRWMFVLELRRAGNSWEKIGKLIARSPSTVKRLHYKAILETQKQAARCSRCGAKIIVVSTRYLLPANCTNLCRSNYDRVLFLGACENCGTSTSNPIAKGQSCYTPEMAHYVPEATATKLKQWRKCRNRHDPVI